MNLKNVTTPSRTRARNNTTKSSNICSRKTSLKPHDINSKPVEQYHNNIYSII